MPTFKLTFEGYYRDQPPITETLTQWVSAESHARAGLSLYDDFNVVSISTIEQMNFDISEYLRNNQPDFPEHYQEEPDDGPSEAIGDERYPGMGVY